MPQISPSRFVVPCGWNDVPHLDEKTKAEILASTPEHMREARTEGIPSLGAGAIYPIPLKKILCEPFIIPEYWPRGFALDVGWNRTACLWAAYDRGTTTLYLNAEYYVGEEKPPVHAAAIKARGAWIPGIIDPAANNRNSKDGERLMQEYVNDHGLLLEKAENAVEAGLYMVWQLLSTGRIKVFSTLTNFQDEYRFYRRDDKGKVVKKNDHLMDCLRYLVLSRYAFFKIREPDPSELGSSGDTGDSLVGF